LQAKGQKLPGRSEFKERDGSHKFARGKLILNKARKVSYCYHLKQLLRVFCVSETARVKSLFQKPPVG